MGESEVEGGVGSGGEEMGQEEDGEKHCGGKEWRKRE